MEILIVDDSTTIRRIVKRTCEELGHTTWEATNGSDALGTLREVHSTINLVILDWNMPGLSGLETLKKIKGDPITKGIPVLMLTSERDVNSSKEVLKEVLAAGAADFLSKPFDGKMLALKIQKALETVNS